jgi:hypothetical protein
VAGMPACERSAASVTDLRLLSAFPPGAGSPASPARRGLEIERELRHASPGGRTGSECHRSSMDRWRDRCGHTLMSR